MHHIEYIKFWHWKVSRSNFGIERVNVSAPLFEGQIFGFK